MPSKSHDLVAGVILYTAQLPHSEVNRVILMFGHTNTFRVVICTAFLHTHAFPCSYCSTTSIAESFQHWFGAAVHFPSASAQLDSGCLRITSSASLGSTSSSSEPEYDSSVPVEEKSVPFSSSLTVESSLSGDQLPSNSHSPVYLFACSSQLRVQLLIKRQ